MALFAFVNERTPINPHAPRLISWIIIITPSCPCSKTKCCLSAGGYQASCSTEGHDTAGGAEWRKTPTSSDSQLPFLVAVTLKTPPREEVKPCHRTIFSFFFTICLKSNYVQIFNHVVHNHSVSSSVFLLSSWYPSSFSLMYKPDCQRKQLNKKLSGVSTNN